MASFPFPLRHMHIAMLIGLLLLTAVDVHAAGTCRVIDVPSGDTIVAECLDGQKEIRLEGVEAPAQESLFWSRARRELSSMLFDRLVSLEEMGTEDGMVRGSVRLETVSVNAKVVRDGLARCRADASATWCAAEEAQARAGQRGLWNDPWIASPTRVVALDRAIETHPAGQVAKASAPAPRGKRRLKV